MSLSLATFPFLQWFCITICCFGFSVSAFTVNLHAQQCPGGPVITTVFVDNTPQVNGTGCLIAGLGSSVTINGFNFAGATVYVVPDGRPQDATQLTRITSQNNNQIVLTMDRAPNNSSLQIRGANGCTDQRCLRGQGPGTPLIYDFFPKVIAIGCANRITLIGGQLNNNVEIILGGMTYQPLYRAQSIDSSVTPRRTLDSLVFEVPNCINGRIIVRNTMSNNADTAQVPLMCSAFVPPAATITNFSPPQGGTGTQVTITGTGFSRATQVRFGYKEAKFTVLNDNTIVATVGNGSTGQVEVFTASSCTAVSQAQFTFVPAPTITEISPRIIGPETIVTIRGTNLQGANFGNDRVLFGTPDGSSAVRPVPISVSADGTVLTVRIGTLGTITDVFPRLNQPNVPVTVRTPGGTATAQQTILFVPDVYSTPTLSLRPANAANGARIEGNTLILRERVATYFQPNPAQSGSIILERRGWNSNLNVMVNLTYRSSTGTVLGLLRGASLVTNEELPEDLREEIQIPIPPIVAGDNKALLPNFPPSGPSALDGILPDLSPILRKRDGSIVSYGLNEIAMPAPSLEDNILYDSTGIHFRARWSDQRFISNQFGLAQSPALQGRRTLTIELVEPTTTSGYMVNPTARTATVVLDDPDPTTSIRVVNPIADRNLAPGATETIDLERFRNKIDTTTGNYLPDRVFLDETYSFLQYTVTTNAPDLIRTLRVEIIPGTPLPTPRITYQLSPSARSGASGQITVQASNGRGGTASQTFMVGVLQGAPIVDRVEPNAAAPGAEVRITGRDLANLRSVAFAGIGTTTVPAEIVSTSADVIVVRVPNTAQTGAITVTTRVASTQTQAFTVIRTPQIQSFSPETAVVGSFITIRGVNFSGVNAVSFGGVSALEFTVVSDSVITARVRNGANGIITLTNPRESVSSLRSITIIPAPIITTVTPPIGGAGSEVVLLGENFTGVGFTVPDSVIIGGRRVDITMNTASRLSFIVPDFGLMQLNNLPIRIVTRGGATTATTTFTFTPCPRLDSFAPQNAGPLDSISIFGGNLAGIIGVTIGGVPVRGFRVVSGTEIRVAVGSVSTGRVRISSAICSDSSATNFTYNAPAQPLLISVGTFGKIFPNETTNASVTLMNLSSQPMMISLALQNDSEGNFGIVSPTQVITLQRNDIVQAVLRFSPKASGIKTAQLTASGQGLPAMQSVDVRAQAGVWQVIPTVFDTIRLGRNTVRAALVINRNITSAKIDAVRLAGDNNFTGSFSIVGTMPRWIGSGDTTVAIVRANPPASSGNRALQGALVVETTGVDTARGIVTAFAREPRTTDVVMEPSFVPERDSVEAGQNLLVRLNLRIVQNGANIPANPQIRGSLRWNKNVLLPQVYGTSPQAQGVVRYGRNTEIRNATVRAMIPAQVPSQAWTGTNAPLLVSIPLGVYYGETNITPLEIEELNFADAIGGNRRVFIEEPQNGTFTAKTFGRTVRSRTSSTLDIVSPSPSTAAANVRYTVSEETAVLLTLVDMQGKRIKTIAEGWRSEGVYEHTFDVSGLASGTYYVMLHTDRNRATVPLKVVR